MLIITKNLRDPKTKIYPSTTRGGKELPSSSALDSPFVFSKLATPTPAIDSDMSHVIDDATSAMHDTYDETTSMSDTTVPLSEFLDEQIARAREKEIISWGLHTQPGSRELNHILASPFNENGNILSIYK